MKGASQMDACCAKYEMEIRIEASPESVWKALVEDTNAWWLPDFHMVDADSTVEIDLSPGGRGLVEHRADGSFLQWYSVQSCLIGQHKIYLVGYLAPDFGGPSTSHLGLSVEADGEGSVLKVVDAHVGAVDESALGSLELGWSRLFQEGLRDFVERQ